MNGVRRLAVSWKRMNSTSARAAFAASEGAERVGKPSSSGYLKRGDQVYTEIVPDASKATLQPIIRGQATPKAVFHTAGGYDGLVDLGFDKHFRIRHGESEFASGTNHLNGIKSFWSLAKQRLVKFNAIPKHTFYLHLKEWSSDSTKDKTTSTKFCYLS